MSLISVELGLTLRLQGGDKFEFIRPLVTVSDIDTEKDVGKQIEKAKEVAKELWSEVVQMVNDEILSQIQTSEFSADLVSKRLDEFAKKLNKLEAAVEELK